MGLPPIAAVGSKAGAFNEDYNLLFKFYNVFI